MWSVFSINCVNNNNNNDNNKNTTTTTDNNKKKLLLLLLLLFVALALDREAKSFKSDGIMAYGSYCLQ